MGDRRRSHCDGATQRTVTLLASGQLVTWGALYYSFAVLLPVMHQALGWSPAMLSAGFSLGLLTSGLLAPSIGGLLDRSGPRLVMSLGSVVGAVGLALWATATQPAVYLLAWGPIGAAMAATLYEPAFAAVIRQQPTRRRGAILTISLVGALASPLFTPVTAWTTERLGWRVTLSLLACAVAATAGLHARLPGATSPAEGDDDGSSGVERAALQAQRRTETKGLTIGIAAAGGVATAANAHLVAALLDAGHSLEGAAALVAGIGLAKIAGRIILAGLPERFERRRVLPALLLLQAVGLLAPVAPAAFVLALPLLFGSASGAMTVLKPLALAELGDTANFARRSGRIQLTTTFGKASAPFLVGAAATSAAGYRQVWWALPALLFGVALYTAAKDAAPTPCAKKREGRARSLVRRPFQRLASPTLPHRCSDWQARP